MVREFKTTRSGLTLLELILAMLLMATILAATWSLLGIFQNRLEKGQRLTEQSQLIRSLHQALVNDLHACQVPLTQGNTSASVASSVPDASIAQTEEPELVLPPPADQATPDALFMSTAFEQPNTQVTNDADAIVRGAWLEPQSFLLGNSHALMFDAIPPASSLDSQPPAEEPPPDQALIPDTVRRVVYVFYDPLQATRLDRPSGLLRCELTMQQLTSLRHLTAGDSDLMSWLRAAIEQSGPPAPDNAQARASEDVSPAESAESLGSDSALERLQDPQAAPAGVDLRLHEHLDYVPEVATFLLRYLDGSTWKSSWDTRQQGRLPTAVEIRFQLAAEVQPLTGQQLGAANDGSDAVAPAESLLAAPGEIEPVDDSMRSAQTRPPDDHRLLIYLGGETAGQRLLDVAAPADSSAPVERLMSAP
jgi:hypothetical protein